MDVSRYQVRSAGIRDEEDVLELARHLDSVNLPYERETIRMLLARSEASFRREISEPSARRYMFVLRDTVAERAIGTSMINGQLGRRGEPYIYFSVHTEERYSSTLDKHFAHQVLSIRYSFDGPTEIGGLVVHPDHRGSSLRLGTMISYVRFLFVAMRRRDFRDQLLAELMPPLEPDGTSLLWEALGRRFTDMSYREADRLSKKNKEFIRGLFPDGPIYATLLDPRAQALIGKVGHQTRGVEKLLRRIGFRYWDRVDPFDGGPHFVAPTHDVTLIRDTRIAPVEGEPLRDGGTISLLGIDAPEGLRAVIGRAAVGPSGGVRLDVGSLSGLGVSRGALVAVLPLENQQAADRG